jgi:1,4-alpha-glucan branching enzyme
MRPAAFFLLCACSLTPIPDVSSNYSPPCDTSQRFCAVEFKLIAAGEKSVELRGDFAPAAWTSGVLMTKDNGYWTATVAIPWGSAVQYKFFVDDMTWETDPGNPKTIVNGGNTNSLLEDVQCATWTCAQ